MSNGKKLLKLPYERGSFYSLIDSLDYESYSIMVEIDGNTYYSTEQVLPQQVKVDSITMDIDPEKRWGTLKYHFFNDEKSAGYYCNTRAFSAKDKFYNREIYEIEFASSSYKDYNKSITKGKTCLSSLINYSSLDSIFYVAELITVSPDLDRFMRSELDYKATVDDLFFDNVIPHYSNIIGGYGIFVAYTVTSMNGYTSKTSIPIAKE